MLEGAWPQVQNPMVINNIGRKLDKAQRYVERRHGTRVRIRDTRLWLEDWGLADQSKEGDHDHRRTNTPDLTFVGTIPDSESSTPIEFKFGDFVIAYHENPKTLGETVGIPTMFTYPQLAVVKAPGATDPQLIVRVEASGMGVPMLCSLDPSGKHKNFGEWPHTDQDSFVRKVAEIASQSQTN